MYLLQESRFFVQGNVAFIQVSFLSHAINPYKKWTNDISLEQSLYKPYVFYQQKNQRNVWKIDWNTIQKKHYMNPWAFMRKHHVIILIF